MQTVSSGALVPGENRKQGCHDSAVFVHALYVQWYTVKLLLGARKVSSFPLARCKASSSQSYCGTADSCPQPLAKGWTCVLQST